MLVPVGIVEVSIALSSGRILHWSIEVQSLQLLDYTLRCLDKPKAGSA